MDGTCSHSMLQVYPVSLINAVRSLRDHFVSLHVIDDG